MRDRLRALYESAKRKLIPGGSLESRTVTSGFWLGSMNVVSRVLQILMLVFLASLLAPRDFGLMGIAMLTLGALKQFSKLGINAALVQKESEDVDHYLDTAWVLNLVRYGLIAAIMVLGAPLVAQLFSEPRATFILQVFAIVPLARGLKNPAVVYFRKDLEYHRLFFYRVSGSVAQFVVAIAWAIVSPTVWALIGSLIVQDVVRTVASYGLHSYRPSLSFNLDRAKEIIDYGKWITGSSILYFLSTEGDDVIVGALVSATALGFYQLAYRLSNAPATEISEVISGVMFPTFSKIQNDVEALQSAYLRVLQVMSFVAFPASFGIAMVAPSFVRAFLGQEWLPMVTAMQLLALYGLTRAIGKTCSPIWKAIGRPDYVTKLTALRVALIAIGIVPLTSMYGIEGTALLVTGIAVVPMLPLDLHFLAKSIDLGYAAIAREMAYPLAGSFAMSASVLAVQNALAVSAVVEFFALVLVGVVSYAVAVGIMVVSFDWGIERNLLSVVDSVRG